MILSHLTRFHRWAPSVIRKLTEGAHESNLNTILPDAGRGRPKLPKALKQQTRYMSHCHVSYFRHQQWR
jgi:hypothetical protein